MGSIAVHGMQVYVVLLDKVVWRLGRISATGARIATACLGNGAV